jgi:hypothetical protein
MSFRKNARVFTAAGALAAGALAASVAEDLFAAAPPMPAPLARDEEFVVRFSQPVAFRQVANGSLRVTQTPGTSDAQGTWVPGRALVDPATNRAVVVRPEAVREYFQLVKNLPRVDAQTAAEKLLARVERTGNLKPLSDVDRALRVSLGLNAGTRLDDPDVYAVYPRPGFGGGALPAYRNLIAGDDALWHAYFSGQDINAFAELQQNPDFERFYHPVDFSTGIPDPASVLRRRENRRALVRRSSTFLTFMPSIPDRADLSDAAYASGSPYSVTASGALRGKVKSLLPARGGVLKFVHGVATFGVEPDSGDGGPFLGGTNWTGTPNVDDPRLVNTTPPSGESEVDPTTDWEDPDNQFTTPVPMRRLLAIRLRFAAPLDPRTVNAAHFTLTKTATVDAFGVETPVRIPVVVSVFLSQTRLGEVRVTLTPSVSLDRGSKYEVRAQSGLRALNGHTTYVDSGSTFVTAQ